MSILDERPVRLPAGCGSSAADSDRRLGLNQRDSARAPGASMAVDTGQFGNPFDDPASSTVQRWAGLVHYAVRLAGRLDELIAVRESLGGRDLSCTCAPDDLACHCRVLADYAQAPADPLRAGGHAMGLTLRRPWASLLMVPGQAGGKTVENLKFSTNYRGPVLIYGGSGLDQHGVDLGTRLGLQCMAFHAEQRGWLGATVLADVHRAQGCCAPWGRTSYSGNRTGNGSQPMYHWIFTSPARLATRPWRKHARGFLGLQPVSWSALIKAKALPHNGIGGTR